MTLSPEIRKRLIGLESSYEEPYPILVQGESSYKANIQKICGYYDEEEGYDDNAHQAALYLEDESTFDPGNSVRVEIDDLTVGYLSRSQARLYREKIKALNAPENPIAICGASIKGGFLKKNGEVADFGVRLDFDINNLSLTNVRIREEDTKATSPALDALNKRLQEKPEPIVSQPPQKNTPPQKKVSNIPFIAILLVAGIVFMAVCLIADQILLLSENAGYLPTRTPAPTQTAYLSPLDKLYLTSTARAQNQPTPTPEATADAYRVQLSEAIDNYQSAYGEFSQLHDQLSVNTALVTDPIWKDSMKAALAELQFAADQMLNLSSSNPIYAEVDKQTKLLASETKLMIVNYSYAVDYIDAAALDRVRENLVNINEYTGAAADELQKLNNK